MHSLGFCLRLFFCRAKHHCLLTCEGKILHCFFDLLCLRHEVLGLFFGCAGGKSILDLEKGSVDVILNRLLHVFNSLIEQALCFFVISVNHLDKE